MWNKTHAVIIPAFSKVTHCFPQVFLGIIFQNISPDVVQVMSTFNYSHISNINKSETLIDAI